MASTPEFDAAALEAGRKLFAQECRFMLGVARAAQLPPPSRPEIAFAGRSNVGKSSLLNALTGRKSLARVSGTPGVTRQLNFFDLGGRAYLVDLPGYGYARAGKQTVAEWNALIRAYLRGRPNLRRLCFLVDSRRGVADVDVAIMRLLDEAAQSYQLVLTKIDKLHPDELAAVRAKLEAETAGRGACHPEVIATSAETGTGLPELRAALAAVIGA
ncbi:MAG: ribosome biogenesis GTP-binding protein YihA/YsxC [Rhodospirillaceae bacterium]|nr:ribosome biogenesis GTP-binding protein YihA/YsxC [Rhodospirillaceae bacterium]